MEPLSDKDKREIFRILKARRFASTLAGKYLLRLLPFFGIIGLIFAAKQTDDYGIAIYAICVAAFWGMMETDSRDKIIAKLSQTPDVAAQLVEAHKIPPSRREALQMLTMALVALTVFIWVYLLK